MIKLLVLWSRPADEAGFDAHYLTTHLELARKTPGLISAETGRAAKGDTFRVAQLAFADVEAMQAAMGSEAGAAVLADAQFLQDKFGVTTTSIVVSVDA